MKSLLKALLVIGLVVVVALQFIGRPDRTNPPEDPALTLASRVAVPAGIQKVLDRSCGDCHSHRTQWPWYSSIAPVSWLVAHDVAEGREHLNFSEWGSYSLKRQASKLEGISREADKGDMPLKMYVLIHGDAQLSEEEKDALCTWAEDLSDSLMAAGR
jgi:hypothetical protein